MDSRTVAVPRWLSSHAPETGARVTRTPREAVARHFTEHAAGVYRYLSVMSGFERDAEDITQEAFLRLYRALAAHEPIENPKAWVFTVARRLMLNHLRHARYEAPKRCELSAALAEVLCDPAPTPEDVLVNQQRHDAVDAAIRELSSVEQHCLYLRAEGFTLRQIGEVVALDLRRVSEVIARAIETVRSHVGA